MVAAGTPWMTMQSGSPRATTTLPAMAPAE
jgi:hypothetical protein